MDGWALNPGCGRSGFLARSRYKMVPRSSWLKFFAAGTPMLRNAKRRVLALARSFAGRGRAVGWRILALVRSRAARFRGFFSRPGPQREPQVVVSTQFLLQGAIYAFQHSGIFLRDAAALYRSGAYSNAVTLALFGREELGRYRLLCDFRRQVVRGERVTLKKIAKKCGDHIAKQRAATLSVVQRGTADDAVGKLLLAYRKGDLRSKDYQKAERALDKLTKRQWANTPRERHEARLRSQYVEPDESGTAWRLPQAMTQQEAQEVLSDAVNDYAVQYDHLVRGYASDAELIQAYQAWASRPDIPEPPSCYFS